MPNFSTNQTVSGLETLTFYVPTGQGGAYTLSGHLQTPNMSAGDSTSAVVTTIGQNGSTIFTSTAGAQGFSVPVLAAAGDYFTVALSSSTATDEVLNNLRATVSLG